MRQIHQLSQVLARVVAVVIGLKGKQQSKEAIQVVNEALNEQLELDINGLLEMDFDDMIKVLGQKEAVNDENLEAIADLFYELADTLPKEDQQDLSKESLLKRSLLIYKHIEKKGNIYSIDRNYKIQEIRERLSDKGENS